MPLIRMKKVWDYCTYNKPFFLFVLFLFLVLNYVQDGVEWHSFNYVVALICFVLIWGYGMSITRDRIHGGYRLPKLLIKDIVTLGIKSSIVVSVYVLIQGVILNFVCSPLGFSTFDLEEMLIQLPETIHMLFAHDPFNTLVFVVLGSILFYCTAFFMEIALARLADTGSFWSSFNLVTIKKIIDEIGWRNYAKDYTAIILAIGLFAFLGNIALPNWLLNYIWVIILDLFMFATQFLGIGAVYSPIKNSESNVHASGE